MEDTEELNPLKKGSESLVKAEDYEELLRVTKDKLGVDKFHAKIIKLLKSTLSDLEVAKQVFIFCFIHAEDSYDRNLTMRDLFTHYGLQLWHNKQEVYGSIGRFWKDNPFREFIVSVIRAKKSNLFAYRYF